MRVGVAPVMRVGCTPVTRVGVAPVMRVGCTPVTRLGATLLTPGLVTMAFLLAVRLLIRDFFSMDIACSSFFGFLIFFYCTPLCIAQGLPNSAGKEPSRKR